MLVLFRSRGYTRPENCRIRGPEAFQLNVEQRGDVFRHRERATKVAPIVDV